MLKKASKEVFTQTETEPGMTKLEELGLSPEVGRLKTLRRQKELNRGDVEFPMSHSTNL